MSFFIKNNNNITFLYIYIFLNLFGLNYNKNNNQEKINLLKSLYQYLLLVIYKFYLHKFIFVQILISLMILSIII